MTDLIDRLLNGITMYRLFLYYLLGIVITAVILGVFNLVGYTAIEISFHAAFLVAVCWLTNKIFGKVFAAPTNTESAILTGLILALIIAPPATLEGVIFVFWAGVLAMASKYILTFKRKHIFNPAAIAVVITSLTLSQSATWWSSSLYMMPVIVIGGLLIMRKVRLEEMVFYFLVAAVSTALVFSIIKAADPLTTIVQLTTRSSLFFLAFVMLTEPITAPVNKNMQAIYAVIVGFLFYPDLHIGSLYSTPELALVAGNLFAFIVSPKLKLFLRLKQQEVQSSDVTDFIFDTGTKLNFLPGQYMEWTLPHTDVDTRGNRRYFTIASSPTEPELRLGVKFYPKGSSYKQAMAAMRSGDTIVGAQLAGDFVLPQDKNRKLVFIAGGIGITPFRSMLKYLIDTREQRDIIQLYTNATTEQIVCKDVFDDARSQLGIRTIYTLTKQEAIPADWTGGRGRISSEMIAEQIPDYRERVFYISGSQRLVEGMKNLLYEMGISRSHVITDFFPGLM